MSNRERDFSERIFNLRGDYQFFKRDMVSQRRHEMLEKSLLLKRKTMDVDHIDGTIYDENSRRKRSRIVE